jgi:hypothetical protein
MTRLSEAEILAELAKMGVTVQSRVSENSYDTKTKVLNYTNLRGLRHEYDHALADYRGKSTLYQLIVPDLKFILSHFWVIPFLSPINYTGGKNKLDPASLIVFAVFAAAILYTGFWGADYCARTGCWLPDPFFIHTLSGEPRRGSCSPTLGTLPIYPSITK